MRYAIRSLASFALLLSAMPASAQCPRGWSGLPEIPAVFDWSIWSATAFDDGAGERLYAGGYFEGSTLPPGPPHNNYGQLARWDGGSWSLLDGIADGAIALLEPYDDGSGPTVFAFGSFSTIDQPQGRTVTRNAARWDATGWRAFPMEHDFHWWPRDTVVFDDGSGEKLYLGGWIDEINGVVVNGIARWNGVRWDGVGGGVTLNGGTGIIGALAVHEDGNGKPRLYAGGSFNRAGGASVLNVAVWNGEKWSAVGGGIPGGPLFPQVQSLASFDDGRGPALFAGGLFQNAAFRHIARWNGVEWRPVSGSDYPDDYVLDLNVLDIGEGPELVVAGRFTSIGNEPFAHIARWNGSRWAPIGAGLPHGSSNSAKLILFDDGLGPALFAYGDFETPFASNIARFGCLRGDLNCDEAVNAFDIEPFILALLDPAGYAGSYPDCNRELADMNADGAVDAFDIDLFTFALR